MTKKIFFGAAVAVLIVIIFTFSKEDSISVETYIVDTGAVEATVANTRSGTVNACKRSKIAPLTSGQISAIYVTEGDSVKAGDLLIELWNENIKAQVKRAEAALQAHRLQQHSICIGAASDERDAKRLDVLAKKELAAEDIVDRATSKASASEATCLAAKSQEKEFEAQLELQNAFLEQTYIRAPFPGTVANISGEVGEITTPSPPGVPTPPAIDLLTADCVYVSAPIDEVDASLLKIGQPVRVSLDAYRDITFQGKLTRISPYVEDFAKQARTVTIDVNFDTQEQSLLVGYSADAEVILANRESTIRIPTEALIEGNKVWIVSKNNIVEEREIKIGIGNWKFTEVTEGLSPGDKVITSLGQNDLKPGITVRTSITD
ncbi:efflux RND transporter periplasmic adaptor subunit [Pleionea sediminis]|uniref:efflux RND transporter periplasmic adaptor subunit n=1 Tax=Pleionea sediminis TaxID=2569479 RepID=UPI0011866873|nr:efflux RND transporter periplasmic adaptor subunit [Pleionea sediminis]